MATAPPARVHPLVDDLMRHLRRSDDGSFHLDLPTLDKTKTSALSITNGEELYRVIGDLMVLAALLSDKLGAPNDALTILESVSTLSDRLVELASAGSDEARARAEEVRRKVDESRASASRPTGPLAGLAPGGGGAGLRRKP